MERNWLPWGGEGRRDRKEKGKNHQFITGAAGWASTGGKGEAGSKKRKRCEWKKRETQSVCIKKEKEKKEKNQEKV